MIQLKCNTCGGIMDVDSDRKEACCPYCGNHMLLELEKGSKDKFNIISAPSSCVNCDPLPHFDVRFYSDDSEEISVSYIWKKETDIYSYYVTRDHILFHFTQDNVKYAKRFISIFSDISYPSEDMKVRLHFWLPEVFGEYHLQNGEYLIAIRKILNTYPLELISGLGVRDVAWMISRLENLLCLLEYSGMQFPGIAVEDLFFEPEHHQIFLCGGWQKVLTGSNYRETGLAVRQIARKLMRVESSIPISFPSGLREFIESQPKATAGDDFQYWDYCLEKAFGKRVFVDLSVDPMQLYGLS